MDQILLSVGIAFGVSSLYFWLLEKADGRGILWWIVMLIGFFGVLMV